MERVCAARRRRRRGRDKIAASKHKGLWVGGPVPLGYRCIDKKRPARHEARDEPTAVGERNISPTFADVARFIAGPDAPTWLVERTSRDGARV
jgi:hypothetical protein